MVMIRILETKEKNPNGVVAVGRSVRGLDQ